MNKIYFLILFYTFTSCQKSTKEIVTNNEASFIDFSLFLGKIKIDSTLINNLHDEELKFFYKRYNNETVWQSDEQRKFVLDELEKSEDEGLNPNDYAANFLKEKEASYHSLSQDELVDYDLQLTKNFHSYLSHINKGKLNPLKIYTDYDLKEKKIDINSLLYNCIDQDAFAKTVSISKPCHAVYKNLKLCLKLLRTFPKNNIPLIDLKTKGVAPGKSAKVILVLKRKLNYWKDAVIIDSLSDKFDKETVDGLKKFQSRHGLYPDGVLGKGTIEALNYTRNQRIEQVCANLERWRWYAKDFGKHHVVINIPDYSLNAIKDGDTTQTQRVVVGKESRRTPVLESKISNINLNPNWTVPPTILAEDVFPDAMKSKAAFGKQRLKIFNWKKKEISAWDWKMEDADKYHYVQMPGRNNALGLMKINFPNKFSVYMHDTNHRDYFKYTFRSLSSGCVRLEKPLEMAAYLLNDEEKWSLKTIQDTTNINHYIKLKKIKEKEKDKKNADLMAKNPLLVIPLKKFINPELKTITIKIEEEIFIHQLYWTAWQTDGKLQFREDIYCLDLDLYSKLRP